VCVFAYHFEDKNKMVKSKQLLALQLIVAIAGIVPILVGLKGIFLGPSGVSFNPNVLFQSEKYPLAVDSHFRYISGYLIGAGVLLLRSVSTIDKDGTNLRCVCLLIFIGGFGRLWGLITVGRDFDSINATLVELILPPILYFWQKRIEKKNVVNIRKIK